MVTHQFNLSVIYFTGLRNNLYGKWGRCVTHCSYWSQETTCKSQFRAKKTVIWIMPRTKIYFFSVLKVSWMYIIHILNIFIFYYLWYPPSCSLNPFLLPSPSNLIATLLIRHSSNININLKDYYWRLKYFKQNK